MAQTVPQQWQQSSSPPAHHQQAFLYKSGLSSSHHDPVVSLASQCIRMSFGPIVQCVADALQLRGGAQSFRQLYQFIKDKTTKSSSAMGLPLMTSLPSSSPRTVQQQQSLSIPYIRSALLVLIQHSIVSVTFRGRSSNVSGTTSSKGQRSATSAGGLMALYLYQPEEALHILRYGKYIELVRKMVDMTAACVIETLLHHGRLRTVDVILLAAETAPRSDRYTTRQTVLEALYKLVQAGFVEKVPQLKRNSNNDSDNENTQENEFKDDDNNINNRNNQKINSMEPPPQKRVKIEEPEKYGTTNMSIHDNSLMGEDATVVALVRGQVNYRMALPIDMVWRVNKQIFHESFRAFTLGRLVSERFGHKVPSCGSMVTAALRYRSAQRYSPSAQQQQQQQQLGTGNNTGTSTTTPTNDPDSSAAGLLFRPSDIARFLPKPVAQALEKKVGGAIPNLAKSLKELARMSNPNVLSIVQTSSNHDDDHLYSVNLGSLTSYLRERIMHQVVMDRYGLEAARVMSILRRKGWLESDTLAEHAMIPAKDVREVLHKLYRARYVDLFQFSTTGQHPSMASGSTIYLWKLDQVHLIKTVTENLTHALWNIQLRRQHQSELGKEWIERAQQANETDENTHAEDQLNYQKFCLGLDRLDYASYQLDETLLILKDF